MNEIATATSEVMGPSVGTGRITGEEATERTPSIWRAIAGSP